MAGRGWLVGVVCALVAMGCDRGARAEAVGGEARGVEAVPVDQNEAHEGDDAPRFRRERVGAPQSASFDAAGNLWLLDGPRLGVWPRGGAEPRWFTAPGGLGRGELGARVCGEGAGAVRVVYAASPERSERFTFSAGAGLEAVSAGVPAEGAALCPQTCPPPVATALPRDARPTKCLRDARGVLWVGTLAHGLWREESESLQRVEGFAGRWVRGLSSTDDALAVVTERGVFVTTWEPSHARAVGPAR